MQDKPQYHLHSRQTQEPATGNLISLKCSHWSSFIVEWIFWLVVTSHEWKLSVTRLNSFTRTYSYKLTQCKHHQPLSRLGFAGWWQNILLIYKSNLNEQSLLLSLFDKTWWLRENTITERYIAMAKTKLPSSLILKPSCGHWSLKWHAGHNFVKKCMLLAPNIWLALVLFLLLFW